MGKYTDRVARGMVVLYKEWPTWYNDPRATELQWDEILGFVGDADYIFRKHVTMKNSDGSKAQHGADPVMKAHGWRPEENTPEEKKALTEEWQAQIAESRQAYRQLHKTD